MDESRGSLREGLASDCHRGDATGQNGRNREDAEEFHRDFFVGISFGKGRRELWVSVEVWGGRYELIYPREGTCEKER